ncbi:hypothetical protein D3C72_2470410 [compost metagenome]
MLILALLQLFEQLLHRTFRLLHIYRIRAGVILTLCESAHLLGIGLQVSFNRAELAVIRLAPEPADKRNTH